MASFSLHYYAIIEYIFVNNCQMLAYPLVGNVFEPAVYHFNRFIYIHCIAASSTAANVCLMIWFGMMFKRSRGGEHCH